jgi:DNA polymerase-3 subunit delta
MEAVFSRAAAKSLFNPVRRVYVLYGEDDRQKDEALALLRSAAVEDAFSDFDVETMDAESATPEDILAASGMAPLGSPFRLVVVRGAEVYRRREKLAETERLAHGIARLGASSCLAFRVAAAEDEKNRKTILTAKLDKAIAAHGLTIRCSALTDKEMADWLVRTAKSSGKRLDIAAAFRLIQAAHGDRLALENELEKAVCYAGNSSAITLDMVEAVSSYDPEDVMFRLVDAISQRNSDRALCLLQELLRYDPKPQSVAGRLLALLTRQYRLLWQARELAHLRVDPTMLKSIPPGIAEELPAEGSITSVAWKGRELFATARNWSRKDLAETFDMLLECDMANKGGEQGSEDVVTNVEVLILRLCELKAEG